MTTTAHEDQFTAEPEPVRQPYDTVAILRRNIADLEVALRAQTERAEAAEAELAKLREQKPVAWRYQDANGNYRYRGYVPGFDVEYNILKPVAIYAVPVPAAPYGVDDEAANRIALAVYDCKNGINPEPLLYAINRILATEAHPLSVDGQRALLQSSPQVTAVPADWREVMAELAADLQSACDAEHPHRDQYPSVMRKYNNDMEIVEKARALLQSAEVRHD